ncbi:MAG: Holliday junction branch migration DNA helicase RuvB [Candidatus Levybacteria bacterium]|nr:Holliday junction branch migration DNA helicase RuvB [Candidatus Levybacteria bacterium]
MNKTKQLPEENIEEQTPEEEVLFTSLRAGSWDEFLGQEAVKASLQIAIEAAKKRGEALEHVLLYGPPGLGKTTLSHIIAREMGSNIRITSGPAIERSGDVASILTNLEKGDILFIDEIHRLNKVVEEMLYPAMEDYALDIIIGKGPSARTVRLDLPQFTIVGATTRIGLLTGPLRDRFGVVHRLNFYDPSELSGIIKAAAEKLQMPIDEESIHEVAVRARGTPRIGLKLLKRARDFAQVRGGGKIIKKLTHEALRIAGVDSLGLDILDVRFLRALIEKHHGGPVGVETLASTISEDIGTLEDVTEPFLLQIGFLKRTPRGRVATKRAYEHIGHPYPHEDSKSQQQKLI